MLRLALTFLSTLFSFNDFPDFLLIACRGDLSDIAEPFVMGAWWVPLLRLYPRGGDFGGTFRRRAHALGCILKVIGNPGSPG